MADFDSEFEKRINDTAKRVVGDAEPSGALIDTLMELLAGLLQGCLSPTPAQLAKRLKSPSALERASLRNQAKRAAKKSGRFSDSNTAGRQIGEILLTASAEAQEPELIAFVENGREQVFDIG